MKTILVSFAVTVPSGGLSCASVKEDLQTRFGQKNFSYLEMSEFDSAATDELEKAVWIYISPDDSEPLYLVRDKGTVEGTPLPPLVATEMQDHGVCTELYGEYPRSDRYGAPDFAVDDLHAKAYVGNQGFKVAEKGFESAVSDRGDDGSEQVWLRIMLPASLTLEFLEAFDGLCI